MHAPSAHPLLDALVASLRGCRAPAQVAGVLQQITRDLDAQPERAQRLRAELRQLLARTDSTHLLTEAGILSDEGLLAGLASRIAHRLAPPPPRAMDLEHALARLVRPTDLRWIRALEQAELEALVRSLTDDEGDWDEPKEYASALVILATRIAGAGVDSRLVERMPDLEGWNSPFLELARSVDAVATAAAEGRPTGAVCQEALAVVDRCEGRVRAFRQAKTTVGTTLELSSASLRMVQQLCRLRLLLQILDPHLGPAATTRLVCRLLGAGARRHHLLDFARDKLDLLAYLVVGNAARKGEGYTVDTTAELWSFLAKSAGGGVLVAVFAIIKTQLASDILAPLPQALLYGASYALCFGLIYVTGATLATKQPAMTASHLARALEGGSETRVFVDLVRAISRCQVVSFVGNVLGAAALTALIATVYHQVVGQPLIDTDKASSLLDSLHPTLSATAWYAAIAGVLLSLTGIVSGTIDNAVVFHRVGQRIASGMGVFRLLPGGLRPRTADLVDRKLGGLSGSVLLGFLLGSAGTVGWITGLPIDIRHVAFASGHGALALLALPAEQAWTWLPVVLVAVFVVGLVNFLVSFLLTLGIAVEARQVERIAWRQHLAALGWLVLRQPLSFVLPPRTSG